VTQAIDTIIHPWRMDFWTVVVGVVTILLIVLLRRTKLGAMGMVVAIVAGSALGALVGEVAIVGDIADIPQGLPAPTLPSLAEVGALLIPAFSLAFVGLVQGAGVSAAFSNPDGTPGDTDRDFIGQGMGNIGAGLFQGMPVGGSMSASSLITSAGAKSRWALVYTAVVMGVVILLFSGAVDQIAMPALAGLLIVVGIETIKPHEILSVYKTGSLPTAVMGVTFALTLVIPLQYAVLVGVGMSMLTYVIRQSNQLDTRRLLVRPDGGIDEVDPPAGVPAHDVVVLQPYGSLFFAAAAELEKQLPAVTDDSVGSVVILRFRGKPDVGSTLIGILADYADSLRQVGSKLMIVTDSERIIDQLDRTGVAEKIGPENLYQGGTRLLGTVIQAASDGKDWVTAHLADRDIPLEDSPIDRLTMGDLPTDATMAVDHEAAGAGNGDSADEGDRAEDHQGDEAAGSGGEDDAAGDEDEPAPDD
jgi:SulP family sulfate permease